MLNRYFDVMNFLFIKFRIILIRSNMLKLVDFLKKLIK